MNKKIIAACAVIFSTIVFGFSSNLTEAKKFTLVSKNSICAVPSFKKAYDSAAAVFVGEVVSEKKVGNKKIFEFEVEKYWKGADTKKIEISVYETMRFQAWFKVGGKYLVFAAANEDGKLRVGRCSRSRDAENASDDLRKLGEGKRPK